MSAAPVRGEAPAALPEPLEPGEPRELGGVTLERHLGTGGFASVHAGRDRDGRPAAIKVLLAEHVGSSAVARFEREIAIVRALRHPGIAQVRRAGTLPDGRPYCVMELLRGRDLGRALEAGPRPAGEVVDIVARVADALGAAHAAGIVHRDVKASNVFLCDDGRVVLLDFGIAKLAAAGGLTVSREAVGSVGAMAPEQLAARPVDARTDVYALGCLVHHLVTGLPPFRARDLVAEIQLHRFAQRPRASAHGAPEAIDPVIARAMAIRPADRYASCAEVAAAVRAALGAAARARIAAVAVHLEAAAATAEAAALAAVRDAARALGDLGFRPLAAGVAGGAWWRDLAGAPAALAAPLAALAARGVAIAVHVDDLDVEAGQAAGGPLAELWRWVPAAPAAPAAPPPVAATPAARATLRADPP